MKEKPHEQDPGGSWQLPVSDSLYIECIPIPSIVSTADPLTADPAVSSCRSLNQMKLCKKGCFVSPRLPNTFHSFAFLHVFFEGTLRRIRATVDSVKVWISWCFLNFKVPCTKTVFAKFRVTSYQTLQSCPIILLPKNKIKWGAFGATHPPLKVPCQSAILTRTEQFFLSFFRIKSNLCSRADKCRTLSLSASSF